MIYHHFIILKHLGPYVQNAPVNSGAGAKICQDYFFYIIYDIQGIGL